MPGGVNSPVRAFKNINGNPIFFDKAKGAYLFDDDVIDFGSFKVLIDSMSYPYLFGSTLDFVEDLSGAKFVINNPNAKTTCGCGESFTV